MQRSLEVLSNSGCSDCWFRFTLSRYLPSLPLTCVPTSAIQAPTLVWIITSVSHCISWRRNRHDSFQAQTVPYYYYLAENPFQCCKVRARLSHWPTSLSGRSSLIPDSDYQSTFSSLLSGKWLPWFSLGLNKQKSNHILDTWKLLPKTKSFIFLLK